MPWLTAQERTVLSLGGVVALLGMGVLLWQRQRPALTVGGALTSRQAAEWDGALRAAREVDINTAGVAELEQLPGIGPTLARRIVDDRERHGPFATPEALARVEGIGPKTYDALKEHLATR